MGVVKSDYGNGTGVRFILGDGDGAFFSSELSLLSSFISIYFSPLLIVAMYLS